MPCHAISALLSDAVVRRCCRARAQVDRRTHALMAPKSACILAGLAAAWYGAFFAFPGSYAASLACAALLGVMKAQVGMSIMHDANHGAVSRSRGVAAVMRATLDLVGASRRAGSPRHLGSLLTPLLIAG
jgi:fatty acid desaturase